MNFPIGATVKLKPGLRKRPQISGCKATVLEQINDRLKVTVDGNTWLIERHEIEQ